MPEEKQINFGISDGMEFFAHEMSLNFSPTQFIFDFRCITPRVDARSKDGTYIALKHNVIMVDPYHAKRMLEVLTNVVGEYEKQYGSIDQPKALKVHEKKVKKMMKDDNNNNEKKDNMPSYLG